MMKAIKYFMEHEDEYHRLRIKEDKGKTLRMLSWAGIEALLSGSTIVDAGSGVGVVTEAAVELTKGKDHTYTLLDFSQERLDKAREYFEGKFPNEKFRFIQGNLEEVALETESVDFIVSRFVFEYLSDQERVFQELKRILKLGGTKLIGDLDHNCMNFYGCDDLILKQAMEVFSAVENTGKMDLYAGRRLYGFFYGHDYNDIDVDLSAHHLYFGNINEAAIFNMKSKLDQVGRFVQQGLINLSFSYDEFQKNFLDFFMSEKRFFYTPVICVKGTKA